MKKNLTFEKFTPSQEFEQLQEYKRQQPFMEGKIPFTYNYEFSEGQILKAWQDEQGKGYIVIEKDGQILFNLSDLLPKDFQFVTPTYFQKFPEQESVYDYLYSTWGTDNDRKIVMLGQFDSPRDLLSLLHEVGHAQNDSVDERKILGEIDEQFSESFQKGDKVMEILLMEDRAKILSKLERRAWAAAVKYLRQVGERSQINIKQIFPKASSIKEYLNENLATYRRREEWIIKEGYDHEFYRELQKYFDKWDYSDKST